ncbi:MAG: riboflavin synthase [Gracilibacteraceae bacterium]|jgi:riboflavin synthase|nr:riboflavin synthase [Gracilibacteraceae bacterium]
MFTGIIEELGSVRALRKLPDSAMLTVTAAAVLEGSKIGDSIAVNGVCLTVTSVAPREFTADVMPETLRRTNLKDLRSNASVNLERALTLQTRCGGHFVSGHIDGVGVIHSIKPAGNAKIIEIAVPAAIAGMIIDRGSIAVDGISLTVVNAMPQSFTVSIIPHTLSQTTLDTKTTGSAVNLETDMLGKYVAQYIRGMSSADLTDNTRTESAGLSEEFLREQGYF